MLDTWYIRLTTWYLAKPWYIRLACIGLVVVIVILFLLRFVAKGVPEEYAQTANVSPVLADPTSANEEEEATNAETTIAMKKKMIEQLKERKEEQDKFAQQASEITNAEHMGDLHELRKKFNL
jgi:hypothetical protein